MVAQDRDVQPFFTIGVPTFNRHALLKETLDSVLAQTFADFEVIVGNDYTDEVLTGAMIGVADPRIRFVNHPKNLREAGNMNALLAMAAGRYFTWLFDDDLYEPDFLQTAHDTLVATGFPPAFFCSYRMLPVGAAFRPAKIESLAPPSEFSGREFLRWYSVFRIKLFSTFGLFDTAVMRSTLRGFDTLINMTIALYSEHLFLAKCGLLDRIVYVDAPFYVYRLHEGSWSESNTELEVYQAVGQELVRRSSEVLRNPALAEDYSASLFKICSLHLIEYAHKLGRHVHYVSARQQQEFGVKAALRLISGHWREASRIRRLYLSLEGGSGLRSWWSFLKVVLFCNYLMASHFFHYSRREKPE